MEGRAAAPEGEAAFAASYLTDAPADLLRAVLAVLHGAPEASCDWALEPEELRWVLRREGDTLLIRVVLFPHWPSGSSADAGQAQLVTACEPLRLATQVRGALRRMLNRTGTEGYEREWRRPFPVELLGRLEVEIERLKADRGHAPG